MNGQRLKDLRLAKGMTQVELALAADLSKTAISDLERGAPSNPRYSTLERLAAALGVSVAHLLEQEGVSR